MAPRVIKQIVIHEADTPTGKPFTVQDIDSWHVERGFKRKEADRKVFNPELKAIGYHFVIYVDGTVHTGRQVEEVGAHVQGMNSSSIGICLIGKGKYTAAQWCMLRELVAALKLSFPGAQVLGHNETKTGKEQGKTCPDFDVQKWLAGNMALLQDHLV